MSRLKQLINSLVYNTKTPNLTFLLDWVFIIVELEEPTDILTFKELHSDVSQCVSKTEIYVK